jgi:hypothetical protein
MEKEVHIIRPIIITAKGTDDLTLLFRRLIMRIATERLRAIVRRIK